jgi:hypothetical protein
VGLGKPGLVKWGIAAYPGRQNGGRMNEHIHHRIVTSEDGTFHFVSLDGDNWLPINRAPTDADTPEMVQALFDGDGNFKPMTFGAAWLDHYAVA